MHKNTTTIATIALLMSASTAALAGGLDRSGQPIGLIFQDGNYGELSFGYVSPTLSGTDALTNPISNVADSFAQIGGGIKSQITDTFSISVLFDQPFGSDVTYPGDPNATLLGTTEAIASSTSISAVARYHINERVSVHGGLRYQRAEGTITLGGLAYGGPVGAADSLNGYRVDLEADGAVGYLIGAAYEIPDIALRVALTYNSEIEHDFSTVESVGGVVVNPGSITEISTPASLNLDFQSGVAEDTLVFGSIRYAEWDNFKISPAFFAGATGGASISDLDASTAYSLGVGRRFNERLSGSLSLGYEAPGDDDLVSPLAPSDGNMSIAIGAQYKLNDTTTLSGGIRYTKLGDARPETGTPDTARADFTDNDVVSVGMRIGWTF